MPAGGSPGRFTTSSFMSKEKTIPSTLSNLLEQVYAENKQQLDELHVTGMSCQDPATCSPGRYRRNFWLWVCCEHNIVNGQCVWLDLTSDSPHWVKTVMDLIRATYSLEGSELKICAKWLTKL